MYYPPIVKRSQSASPVVQLFCESPSILDFGDGVVTSAADLADQGRVLGRLFTEAVPDLKVGDRVGLWMVNGEDYVRSFLACADAGYVAVSVNTRYSRAEVEELLERSGTRLVITDQEWTDPRGTIEVLPVEHLAKASASKQPVTVEDPESDLAQNRCVVFTTSGTTSKPKMVAHTQDSIAGHARDVAGHGGFEPGDVALGVMPFCGTFGLASLTGYIAAGCTRILVPAAFDAEVVASLIEEQRVTVCTGSDDMFHRLLATGRDLSSIRVGGYARFNTSLDGIVDRADEAGVTLVGLYGMSEVQALFAIREAEGDPARRANAGGQMVSSHAEVRVVDGELQLRGTSLFEGYLAEGGDGIDSKLTESSFEDGWFKTGDSGQTGRGDRDFTFVARLGDVLRIGGFLVAPAEIEEVITQMSTIDAAQVVEVGLPVGARPVAFAISPDLVTRPSQAQVQTHCAAVLARFKIPIQVLFVDEFPTIDGPNGLKIRRSQLRKMAQAAVEEADGS